MDFLKRPAGRLLIGGKWVPAKSGKTLEVENPANELVIATVDPDDRGTRRDAWLRLVERAGRAHETAALKVRVLRWDNLCALTSGDQLHPPFESGAQNNGMKLSKYSRRKAA